IRALLAAGAETPAPPVPPAEAARQETPIGTSRTVPPLPPLPPLNVPAAAEPLPPMETPRTQLHPPRDESPAILPALYPVSEIVLRQRVAPPEVTGDGALRPAVVVGIGQVALDVIREFRHMTQERFGTADRVPHLRLLFLDSDSETLHAATASAGLVPAEVIP